MIEQKTTLPDQTVLRALPFDYIDSFQGVVDDKENKIKPIDVCKAFFTAAPNWVHHLFTFRNKLVGLFGLKTSGEAIDSQKLLNSFTCRVGEQVGLFKVLDTTDNEVIIGEDDKHLNFRVSLLLSNVPNSNSQKHLTITTAVQFNNAFGKLYFLPVKPFHKMIVPAMLKRMIKQLKS